MLNRLKVWLKRKKKVKFKKAIVFKNVTEHLLQIKFFVAKYMCNSFCTVIRSEKGQHYIKMYFVLYMQRYSKHISQIFYCNFKKTL